MIMMLLPDSTFDVILSFDVAERCKWKKAARGQDLLFFGIVGCGVRDWYMRQEEGARF